MSRLKTTSVDVCRETAQILKIEGGLYEELLNHSGIIGKVGQVYRNGFDLIRKDESIIHFRGGLWLHSPFGIVIDHPIQRWVKGVALREGDVFEKTGKLLRRTGNGCSIRLNPYDIVNLKRTLCLYPPKREVLLFQIQVLCEEIFRRNRFEGVAGVLCLLVEQLPSLAFSPLNPMSFWSRHALPRVRKLMLSVLHEDVYDFELAWEGLLGLGPGLTPAADDFLVGFLAAHKLFSSPFGRIIADDDVRTRLEERARIKTVPTSFNFLKCALEGIFSEILYLAFEDLKSRPENGRKQIEYFLKWGHSSGADTLTGVVFGLWTMIPPDEKLETSNGNYAFSGGCTLDTQKTEFTSEELCSPWFTGAAKPVRPMDL